MCLRSVEMEIIQQELQKMTTQIKILKEENGKFTDSLDEKDEEIAKLKLGIGRQQVAVTDQSKEIKRLTEANQILDTKLTQKSNEVDTHQSRLSHEHNGMKSKLANREKQIKELKEQIDQTKINALVAKDNEIARLEQKVKKLESSTSDTYDEFMKSVNKVGYVKHRVLIGRYNNDKPKYKTCFLPEDIVQHLKECPQKAPLRPVV